MDEDYFLPGDAGIEETKEMIAELQCYLERLNKEARAAQKANKKREKRRLNKDAIVSSDEEVDSDFDDESSDSSSSG
jgi:hypothetical protein